MDNVKYEQTIVNMDIIIKKYLEDVIKLHVVVDNKKIPVTVVYKNSLVESNNKLKLKDKHNKLKLPILTIERQGETIKDDVYHSIFPFRENSPSFDLVKKWKNGRYIIKRINIPVFMECEYNIEISADYIIQINNIKEQLLFHNKSYWYKQNNKNSKTGNNTIFCKFDSFSNENISDNQSEEGYKKTSFNMTATGKIITKSNIKNVETILRTKINFKDFKDGS